MKTNKKEEANTNRSYLGCLARHIRGIVGVNLLYVVTNILFFATGAYLMYSYYGGENFFLIWNALKNGQVVTLSPIPFLPFMLTGPFSAGLTYVTRNYAKAEHTFIASDFFEHTRKNIWQSLCTSVLFYLVFYLLLQAFFVYNATFSSAGIPLGVLYVLFGLALVLLFSIRYYAFAMIVTFRMSYKTILKNAWTFAIIKLPQNFILFAFLAALHLSIIYITCAMWMLFEVCAICFALILPAFTSYTANYYIWSVLEKYIVRFVVKPDDKDVTNND